LVGLPVALVGSIVSLIVTGIAVVLALVQPLPLTSASTWRGRRRAQAKCGSVSRRPFPGVDPFTHGRITGIDGTLAPKVGAEMVSSPRTGDARCGLPAGAGVHPSPPLPTAVDRFGSR
jgi:hypothetical protein